MDTVELKNEQSVKTLPTFDFITDVPMQSLYITDEEQDLEQKGGNQVIETRKGDSRVNDGRKRVRLIASSDATDLVGDVMSKAALNQMKNAAVGTTIFLNHDATVPESVFGSVEKAELVARKFTVTDGGKQKTVEFICLEYDVLVEETHDRAIKVWEMINAGTTKLGASITIAIIAKSPMSGGRRLIDEVIYLETSIVGIPCNQTAWVEYAKYVKNFSWIQQARKALTKMAPATPLPEAQKVDIDALYVQKTDEPESSTETELPVATPKSNAPFFAAKSQSSLPKEQSMDTLKTAKTSQEFVAAFKSLFTEAVEDHFSNPWLYMYILEDCMMELIYWNTNMPTADKLDAANVMFDDFKIKMMEILTAYWSEDDDSEKAVKVKQYFDEAATKHLQFMMKEGRRNNERDQATIQKIHDMSCSLGAGCEEKIMKTETVVEKAPEAPLALGEAAAPTVSQETLDAEKKRADDLAAEKVALEAKNTELVQRVADLEAANKQLGTSRSKWKATAFTTKAMLDSALSTPAPRPGASSN